MMGQGGMPDLSALGGAGMPDMSQMFGGGLKGKIGEFAMKQSMKRMANKMKKRRRNVSNTKEGEGLSFFRKKKNEHFRNWKCSFFDMFKLLVFIFVWQDQVQDDSCHG